MRVIIAGGRERTVTAAEIDEALKWRRWEVTTLVCGMAPGVDTCALEWAKARGVEVEAFFPAWAAEGRKAGPLRNTRMVQNADALLAFPGRGFGTMDTIEKARALGLPVEVR